MISYSLNIVRLKVLLAVSLWTACSIAGPAKNGGFQPSPIFTASPIDPAAIRAITPLGNLNPEGGHIFPTDHIYLDFGDRTNLVVRAPCAGTVFGLHGQYNTDFKVEIRVNTNLSYYLAHILPVSGIQPGSKVRAGQILGRVSSRAWLDLGACDVRVHLTGFANPARYPWTAMCTVCPLSLFAEPLKSRLYNKVFREDNNKDGKFDFDQMGKLVGNWFHESLAEEGSTLGDPAIWAKQLAFVYDVHRPSSVRISIGGTIAPAGAYAIPAEAPDPATVTMESGLVQYKLLDPYQRENREGGNRPLRVRGVLLVQLTGKDTLRVEYFEGKPGAEIKGFTAHASLYRR
jgi:hypothetical protein